MGKRRPVNMVNMKKWIKKSKTPEVHVKKEKMRVSMHNADGYNDLTEFDTINFIKSQKPEIHGVIESKIREEDARRFKIPGYETVEVRRSDLEEDREGGGLMVFIKKVDGIRMQERKFKIKRESLQYVQKERIWVTSRTSGGDKLAVGFVYVSHQESKDKYGEWNDGIYEVLEDEIKVLKNQGFKVMINGDMNAWVGDQEGGIPGNHAFFNKNGERLRSFLERRKMMHVNGSAACTGVFTRHNSRSSSALDFVCVFEEDINMVKRMFVDEKGLFGGNSDHVFIVSDLEIEYVPTESAPTAKSRKAKKWMFEKETDWKKFGEEMDEILFKNEDEAGEDVDKLGELCVRAPVEALLKVVGKVGNSPSRPKEYPVRIRKQLNDLKLKRSSWREQRSETTRNPSTVNKKKLAETEKVKEKQKGKVDEALREFWSSGRAKVIEKLQEGGPDASKLFWKYVVNKNISATEFTVLEDPVSGELIAGQDEKKEIVENFLKDLFQGEFKRFQRPVEEKDLEDEEDAASGEEPNIKLEKNFSKEEIEKVVRKLKDGKAMGTDDVPNEALKHATPKLLEMLTKLYNLVQKKSKTPEIWKTGRLVLIHKSGAQTDLGNFRPLTVIVAQSGLFSKVLNERLTEVVEEQGLLGEIQQGFRKNRRGADNTFILNTILMKCSAKKRKPHLAFLDIKKVRNIEC